MEWKVATDVALTNVVRSGTVTSSADSDHTITADVDGLDPATDYFYGFTSGSAASPIGRCRTAPATDAQAARFRFGHVSCSNYAAGFAVYRSDDDLRTLHARYAFITTLDDHEITDDAWANGAQNHDLSEGDYIERRNAALRAYDEWMPIRFPTDGPRFHRRLEFGKLADLTMLDLRQYRSQQVTDIVDASDPSRTMLGTEQKQWLVNEIGGDSATWRLVGNSVQMMQVKYPGAFLDAGDGTGRNVDAWDGYTAERDELLGAVGANPQVGSLVFFTGDIHSSWASDLRVDFDDPSSPSVATEFVCTSITSDNLNEILGARRGHRRRSDSRRRFSTPTRTSSCSSSQSRLLRRRRQRRAGADRLVVHQRSRGPGSDGVVGVLQADLRGGAGDLADRSGRPGRGRGDPGPRDPRSADQPVASVVRCSRRRRLRDPAELRGNCSLRVHHTTGRPSVACALWSPQPVGEGAHLEDGPPRCSPSPAGRFASGDPFESG